MGIYHETRRVRRARQPAAVGHVVKMRVVSAASLIFASGSPTAAGVADGGGDGALGPSVGTLPSCLDR